MIRAILVIAMAALLAGCESTNPKSASDGSPQGGENTLKAVAGVWEFSHVGPPSIQMPDDVDVEKLTKAQLEGAKISIQENGNASVMAMGQSKTFQAAIVEASPLYLKIGADDPDFRPENAYLYDRKSKRLVMPINIDNDGSKGSMPAYFKRVRRLP